MDWSSKEKTKREAEVVDMAHHQTDDAYWRALLTGHALQGLLGDRTRTLSAIPGAAVRLADETLAEMKKQVPVAAVEQQKTPHKESELKN